LVQQDNRPGAGAESTSDCAYQHLSNRDQALSDDEHAAGLTQAVAHAIYERAHTQREATTLARAHAGKMRAQPRRRGSSRRYRATGMPACAISTRRLETEPRTNAI
jgi:hypothetical protein